jgi:hypothetical protein
MAIRGLTGPLLTFPRYRGRSTAKRF